MVGVDGLRGCQPRGGKPGGVCWGGARHRLMPKSKPKPAAIPAGGPPQPHPTNPRDAFARALGAISPALDRQGTVC